MVRWAGMTDGDFGTLGYHPECREAEIELNKLHGTWSSDEWIALWDFDWEDARWLLEEHPIVAERKGVTVEKLAAYETRWKRQSTPRTPHE